MTNEKKPTLYYSCNQCGGIHQENTRPLICETLMALARGVIGSIDAKDSARIYKTSKCDEECRQ